MTVSSDSWLPEGRGSLLWILPLALLMGMTASFLGIGGGLFFVPFLVFVAHLCERKSRGTSLGLIIFVSTAALLGYFQDFILGRVGAREPRILAALLVAPGSILASAWTASRIHKVPVRLLKGLFGLVVLLAGFRLLDGGFGLLPQARGWIPYGPSLTLFVVLPPLGLLVGSLSALAGVGGGILMIPAFEILFLHEDFSFRDCQTTSLLVVLPTAIVGFANYSRKGSVSHAWVGFLVLPAVLGALLGAWSHRWVPSHSIKWIFGVFLLLVGFRILLRNLRAPKGDPC